MNILETTQVRVTKCLIEGEVCDEKRPQDINTAHFGAKLAELNNYHNDDRYRETKMFL